jgi:hypothetical protein
MLSLLGALSFSLSSKQPTNEAIAFLVIFKVLTGDQEASCGFTVFDGWCIRVSGSATVETLVFTCC